MRRFISHIVALLIVSFSYAQILAPMGQGLPAAPKKIASYNDGVVVAYSTSFDDIDLQIWNGDFWYKLQRPNLEKTSETYKIIDLISHNGEVYLATGKANSVSSKANQISKWDGSNWTSFKSPLLESSISIDKLFVEGGYLKCVGKFTTSVGNYNIAKLDGTWQAEGNLITTNIANDRFSNIAKNGDKLYAVGKFTNPADPNLSLAVWNGSQWDVAKNPPFLAANIAIGNYQNRIVVYGKSNFKTVPIRASFGGVWQDMSEGLESYDVEDVTQFAEVNNNLFAVGSFTNKLTSESVNIMMYDGEKWTDTKLYLSNIEQLHSSGNKVMVSGQFSDNARLNGIGQVFNDRAQITARVYNDKNANCFKDNDEEWLANYPIALKGKAMGLPTDRSGQVYLQVDKDKHTLNAETYNYYVPTCPDVEIDAVEYRTYYGTALGVRQLVGISDAAIHISDLQSNKAQLNELKKAQVCIENTGGQPINDAIVKIEFKGNISDFTSEVDYESFANNEVIWKVDVSGNASTCFAISYIIKTAEDVELAGNVSLKAGVKDSDLRNNNSSIQYKKGDTEGNSKYCFSGETINLGTESIKYKVSFKNNGNTTAHSLKVVDELDPTLAFMINRKIHAISSHLDNEPYSSFDLVYLQDGRRTIKIITHFDDLYLASAEQDNDNCEGFIDYDVQIEPNDLVTGLEMCNTAKIYFSYKPGSFNEPIITNTVCSKVGVTAGDLSGLPSYNQDLTIGPNPVVNFIYFQNQGNKKYSINIVNTLGQSVSDINIAPFNESKLDVRALESGVYFIYTDGVFAQKIVLH
jgi:uncharacterized repeat protein (TIGR01451 family)